MASRVWNASLASETSACSNAARCPGGATTSTCTGAPSRGSARSVTRYCVSRSVSERTNKASACGTMSTVGSRRAKRSPPPRPGERMEPGRELLRIGERGEQQALVPALAGDHAERERRGEPRVAVALGDAPLDHGLAVAAAQVRDLVLVEVLAREIGDDVEQRPAPAAQVFAELGHAEIGAREPRLELERGARAVVDVMVVGREIEDALRRHG